MAFDWHVLHADPGRGAEQPLSPPKEFAGTGDEYVHWLRNGWSCPRRRQYLRCVARMMRNPAVYKRPEVRGPYARQALQALERIAKGPSQQPGADAPGVANDKGDSMKIEKKHASRKQIQTTEVA